MLDAAVRHGVGITLHLTDGTSVAIATDLDVMQMGPSAHTAQSRMGMKGSSPARFVMRVEGASLSQGDDLSRVKPASSMKASVKLLNQLNLHRHNKIIFRKAFNSMR
jgi:hypothetical protein